MKRKEIIKRIYAMRSSTRTSIDKHNNAAVDHTELEFIENAERCGYDNALYHVLVLLEGGL